MKSRMRIILLCFVSVLFATAVFAQTTGGGGGGGGATTSAQGVPNTASNAWPFFATVGGTAVSATNGMYFNVLQGNAILSATNGTFANLLQGNAALSITNPLFASTFIQPLTNAQGGNLAAVVSSALEASHSISGAKNLYSAYAVSTTGAAGYLVCVNATSISAGAITPIDIVPIIAGPSNAFISYGTGPAGSYGTGITCAVTTASTPFTYTSGGSVFYYHILAN